ncbi:MAG TPA: sulfite reductase subunit alpha [Pseudomonas sp.]|nr:sulfite reductase subunit alpha [Pseudomonas sp.]
MPRWLAYWPLVACLLLAALLFGLQPSRELSALLVTLVWLGLCLQAWRRARSSLSLPRADRLPVAYASQAGQARQLAERTVHQLNQGGLPAVAVPLDSLTASDLASCPRLLLILATYGEGEPPDNGARFLRQLADRHDLRDLSFALLGLGDSAYQQFCGFARRVDQRLRQLGASALFDRLEADRLAPATLSRWQWQLGQLCGQPNYQEWTAPEFMPWRLVERQCLNPGSQGAPVYRIRLRPQGSTPSWQAGDIAEIAPRLPLAVVQVHLSTLALADPDGRLSTELAARRWPADIESLLSLSAAQLLEQLAPQNHRDYSIASLPSDGALELLVRLAHHPDGSPGLGSGWLCLHAEVGERIDLRIRANPSFQLSVQCGPLVLIGNGTGLAGLRAHLREREALGQHGHWLLFGERNAAHDHLFAEELERWLASGHLARLDRVFSRDQAERCYVQHRLRDQAEPLRQWIDGGATVLVCGSLEGMGRDVDALLRGLLGTEQVDELARAGRYRRDLY